MIRRRIIFSKQHKDLVLSAVALLGSLVTVVTCSAVGPSKAQRGSSVATSNAHSSSQHSVSNVSPSQQAEQQAAQQAEQQAAQQTEQQTEQPTAWSGRWVMPADLGNTPEGNAVPALPRFFDSLARLESGHAKGHVRIAWIGDSHTQADGWTHAVRVALQSRFGNGGPGFIHVGWTTNGYRREGVVLRSTGPWSLLPAALVSQERVGDGVMGLGGLRVEPRGSDATASVAVSSKDLPGKGTWDLSARLMDPDASLVLMLDEAEHRLVAEPHTLSRIQHVSLESKGPGGTLQVKLGMNRPQLLGVVVEAKDQPGVVLDTLGLNGARYRSALAWDEATYVAELARREPELVILAFGSNESSDPKPNYEAHQRNVKALVGRVRKAAPQADCLVFGPVDRGGPTYEAIIAGLNEAQAAAAKELGCAYWNGQQAMGGPGSMQQWAKMVPQLGGGDRLHLTMRGYKTLGEMLARDILAGYEAGVVRVK